MRTQISNKKYEQIVTAIISSASALPTLAISRITTITSTTIKRRVKILKAMCSITSRTLSCHDLKFNFIICNILCACKYCIFEWRIMYCNSFRIIYPTDILSRDEISTTCFQSLKLSTTTTKIQND